ncbi:amidase [Paenibacillus sp. P96]|uniref:Amidase n=1 Tax=Paenibacillus zeirhizosphaerae TaxID=2987519 RepID=A0ABT9FTH2_9BACL|nr:amidase [Paenibacillus sp. P96]MDP4097990.1 amidase [Paenibacillus sp. P96]
MKDQWNAVVNQVTVEPTGQGTLGGLSFMVKDVFAVRDYTNGAGNPRWLETHGPAAEHAEVVSLLLQQGARLTGMTHTDELMFSLNGENVHYGPPVNPKAPDRIPGGSSNGSAVAVAAGLADFALGTDTGGSVRVPSSYCGVYGMRPTHGIVSEKGVIPLARSFDTVGWMARDPETLRRVGEVLLPESVSASGFSRVLIGEDAWELADAESKEALASYLELLRGSAASHEAVRIAPQGLPEWMTMFRTIQGYEIWQEHGAWIERERPIFGPDIAGRFSWASTLERADQEKEAERRLEVRKHMAGLLGTDSVLVIPTTTGAAPKLGLSGPLIEERRVQTMRLTCIAGLSGLPQLTIPAAVAGGCPVGISLIAGPGQDRRLLEWAASLVPAVKG